MFRIYLLSIFLAWFITPNLGFAQCNTNLGDLSGFQTPQENAAVLDSAACELALVLGDTTFKVFHTSFYAEQEYYGYYKYPDAFELQRQEAMAQCESYLLIGWQNDSKGINSQFFVDLKLGDVPGTGCVENFPELAKGFLVDRIQKEYDSYYSSPQSASLSAGFGIRKLVEYINDLKSCCQQGGNVEECIACEKPSGTKAYLTALGFRSVQIYNIHPTGQTSSGTIEDLAGIEFMIEDLSTVSLAEQYTNVVSAFGAENMTVKVIITKDEIMCTQQWDDLLDMAKSGQYDVVYWHHIHKGSGPGDQWMYTNAWIKGAQGTGNKPDSTGTKRIATNVVAGLASAATDFLFQVLAHYFFDEDVKRNEWGKAVGRVDYWEVTKSAVFGMFGVNEAVAAVASSLANATVKTVKLANYYETHGTAPSPPNPPSYTMEWAAKDFSDFFVSAIIDESIGMLLGGAAKKALGQIKQIPFSGWCKIAQLVNRKLGTTIPGCFGGGTLIQTPSGFISIEKLQPGDWVLSDSKVSPFQFVGINLDNYKKNINHDNIYSAIEGVTPLEVAAQSERKVLNIPITPDYDFEAITPDSWKITDLEITEPNGTICIAHMLRPQKWLDKEGYRVIGDSVLFEFPEMGINGMAKVTGFSSTNLDLRSPEAQALLERGYYPVLTTFKHKVHEVVYLYFTNADRITTTAPHPFWSKDRDGWLPAEKINIGERLQTYSGELIIDSICRKPVPTEVFNLEVWSAHNFYIGDSSILVHNGCNFVGELDRELKNEGVYLVRISEKFTDGLPEWASFYGKKVINGLGEVKVFYNKFGFPDFKNWCPGPNFCFIPSNGLKGTASDFTDGYRHLLETLGSSVVRKIPEKPNSTAFQIFDGNVWKTYTWHHHEDCKTLMPVLQEVHSKFSHTGGDSMIKLAKDVLLDLFDSPY